jgi:transposase-like protein
MAAKRSWTAEQKIALLDEACAPGACVSEAAERHEIDTGQSIRGGGFIWMASL